jgi:uncharacterized protein (TIGR02646 family)
MVELSQARPEPEELAVYRRRNPDGSWDDAGVSAVSRVVRRQLNLEQHGICVYCETLLGQDKGHVEHIKSKRVNRPLTFVYDNLAHSCDGPGHCGHHKGGQTLPVEPRPGCNRFFVLLALDGKLDPARGLTPAEAQDSLDSIRMLGLNHPSLAGHRRGYVDAIRYLPDPADREEFIAGVPFRWSLRTFLSIPQDNNMTQGSQFGV